jgi:hypothetical protein
MSKHKDFVTRPTKTWLKSAEKNEKQFKLILDIIIDHHIDSNKSDCTIQDLYTKYYNKDHSCLTTIREFRNLIGNVYLIDYWTKVGHLFAWGEKALFAYDNKKEMVECIHILESCNS